MSDFAKPSNTEQACSCRQRTLKVWLAAMKERMDETDRRTEEVVKKADAAQEALRKLIRRD